MAYDPKQPYYRILGPASLVAVYELQSPFPIYLMDMGSLILEYPRDVLHS